MVLGMCLRQSRPRGHGSRLRVRAVRNGVAAGLFVTVATGAGALRAAAAEASPSASPAAPSASPFSPPLGADAALDVWSYNVWAVPYGVSPHVEARVAAIADAIVARRPHLVALQELWRSRDAAAMAGRLETAGYHHHHFGPGAGGPDDEKGSGLFIASRLPIETIGFFPFDAGRTGYIPWHVDWMAFKGVGAVRVTTERGPLWFATTHLQANYRTGDYAFVQLAQAVDVVRVLGGLGPEAPLLVTGDFNGPPASLSTRLIVEDLGLRAARPGYGLDHILARPGATHALEVVTTETLLEGEHDYGVGDPGILSDHPCLTARYRLVPCATPPCPRVSSPPPGASLTPHVAAVLGAERRRSERWSRYGVVLCLAAAVGAVIAARPSPRRLPGRRRLRITLMALLVVVASYLGYIGLHFAPTRRAEIDRFELQGRAPIPLTPVGP
ncbi:MAG: endonuclease/exonuclease/phosphatase family protein [Myxococcota bacterium]